MSETLSVHRPAAAFVAANLGIGLIPFLLLAACHPSIRWQMVLPLGISLLFSCGLSWLLAPRTGFLRFPNQAPFRRLPACLLLGSSFAAIPWKQQSLPLATFILAAGFGIRWWLFALETVDLRRDDQRRQPLPCAATRIRRTCTMITGAVIPLLLLAGLPWASLLWISFGLTLFCQWTVAGEICHSRLNHRFASCGQPSNMSHPHASNGEFC
jgi:hypothetical protein